MTDEQMRERIKEIDSIRVYLKAEKEEYLMAIYEKEEQAERILHEQCIGKCFITKNLPDNRNSHIKAFKVIEIPVRPNDYARCLILESGSRTDIWNTWGISNTVLGLWTSNDKRKIPNKTDKKVIDFYQEISEEEFADLYRQFLEEVSCGNV